MPIYGNVSYRKNCKCKTATATTGQIRCEIISKSMDKWTARVTFHEGPVCDKCGTPWKIVK